MSASSLDLPSRSDHFRSDTIQSFHPSSWIMSASSTFTNPLRSQWRLYHAGLCRLKGAGSQYGRRWSGESTEVSSSTSPGDDYAHLPAGLYQAGHVILQIKVIGTEIMVGVHADYGVEKLVGERQRVGFGMDRKHGAVDS